MTITDEEIDTFIKQMPSEWRWRWCEAKACACMGAANCSGGLSGKGISKSQWEEWVKRHIKEAPADVKKDAMIQRMKEALMYYADANSTVRVCVAGDGNTLCANVDLSIKAQECLRDIEEMGDSK